MPEERFLILKSGHGVSPRGRPTIATERPGTDAVITTSAEVEPDTAAPTAGESKVFSAFPTQSEPLCRIGDVRISLTTRFVARGEYVIKLKPREFSLLACLMSNAPTVLDRPTLHEKVWGYHFDPRTNVVESHISRLRAKLDRAFAVKLIQTVRGVGYRFRVPS